MKYSRLLLVAICFIAIQFFPLLLGKTLFFGDNYSLMVPGKLFTIEWIKQGVLPLWNPNIFSGIPWIGDVNQSIFYPTTVLFLLFSPAVALNISIIIHELLAFFGMVFLVSRWHKDMPSLLVGGILWMFSTHMLGSIHNLSTLQSVPWLPWIIWAGLEIGKNRRAPILFGLLVTAQFAGGYPQHILLSIGTAVLFSSIVHWKKMKLWSWLKSWLLAGLAAVGLSAVIWLPFVDVFMRSTRMLQTAEQAQVGSLHPVMLAKMVLVTVFDNAQAGMKWGPAWSGQPNAVFYITWIGIFVLLQIGTRLKRLARFDVFLFVLSLITLFVSFGSHLPFYTELQTLIPLLRVGRYPSMLLIITNIALILIVARHFSKVALSKVVQKRLSALLLMVFVGAFVALAATHFKQSSFWGSLDTISGGRLSASPFHTLDRDIVIFKTLLTQLVLISFISIVSLYFLSKRKFFLVALLIGLDIVVSTHGMFIFADNSVYSAQEELQNALVPEFTTNQGRTRFLTRNSNMPYADFGSYWEALVVRAPFSDSYVDEVELSEQIVLRQLRDGLTPNWNMVVGVPFVHGYTTLLPQDYAALWQTSELPGINFIDSIQSENPLLAQWAVSQYVVDTWFPLYNEVLPPDRAASEDSLDFYAIPNALDRFRHEDDAPANILEHAETPNEIALTLISDNQERLIIADRYDKDWRATVNDREVVIEKHNGMRSLPIEQGTNTVVMWYEPRKFYVGLVISVLTILASVIAFVSRKPKS